MIKFNIPPHDENLKDDLIKKIDGKTKPLGALGRLEELAIQIGLIQRSISPKLDKPVIIVFAGDHGITAERVSAFPQEVTYQMVLNFLHAGAAINVFCKQNDIILKVVDAGVNYDFARKSGLVHLKIRKGTRNFLHEAAMTSEETMNALRNGASVTRSANKDGSNIIGFGEMGIGNTTAASALMSVICGIPVVECVGKGTGLTTEEVLHKTGLIKQAIELHGKVDDPLIALQTFGGYEIAQLTGAMLAAAEEGMILMIDGFISTTAFLVAYQIDPKVMHYAIFCHRSNEIGHTRLLDFLGVRPLLDLNMRLGEGTGVAVAYPIIKSAIEFLNQMASFKSASVSGKN